MNIDQLLVAVEDLSTLTTTEQLQASRGQCQDAHHRLKGASGMAEREEEKMLLAAIARIDNKIAAIKFSERWEAQRALKAAATIPEEEFTATRAKLRL